MTTAVEPRPCYVTKPHRAHTYGVTTEVPYPCPGVRKDPSVRPTGPRRRHGLGREGVDALLALQGGSCAICGVPYEDKPGKRLAMDHDHRHCEGRMGCPVCVRGMLCNHCNNILRLSGESIERLEAAIEYIRKHQRSYP